jgi:uncharacterized protein (TIGR03086 family)
MELLDALDRAADGFSRRLAAAGEAAWSNPTPCTKWDVRTLVKHVIGGNAMSAALLGGGRAADVMPGIRARAAETADADLRAAFEESRAAQRAAFRVPGALDGMVNHPVGDIPATIFLGFRASDLAIHSWDLARATGGDEQLDPEVLDAVWRFAEPMAAGMRATGLFGEGASGTLGDDAPLQDRVLDLHGRRP